MSFARRCWPIFFFLLVIIFFFWPFFFKGWLSFPGDLLVGHYAPWNSFSFLGYAPGGVPHKAQGIDVVRQFFPWKHFSLAMLQKGQIPLWNPYYFSGNPHLANFQSGIFYPLNIIFFLFSFNLAWTIFIILQPLLACCFTYLLAREFKMSRPSSLFASLAFSFCLFFTVWIEYGNIDHAFLWLPLALFLVEKIIKEIKIKWFLLLIFSLTNSLLAGFIQVTIYLFVVVFAYFFFRLFSKKIHHQVTKALGVLFSGAVALSLTSFQWLPTLEIFSHSARQAYPVQKIPELLLPWFYPVTSFIADFFGNPASRNYWYPGTYIERVSYLGVLPLFFAFLALLCRRQEKKVFFFILLMFSALFLSLNLPPVRFFYSLKIPLISTTVFTRLLSLFSFAASLLAGFGLDFWLKNKNSKKLSTLIIFYVAFYLFLWLLTLIAPKIFPQSWWVPNLNVSLRNLILPTAIIIFGILVCTASLRFPKRLLVWLLVLATIFDLFFYFRKITPFSPPEFVFPANKVIKFLQENNGLNRFWGYGAAHIDGNFSTFTHTFSAEGWDALYLRRYGELLAAALNQGVIPETIPRSDAFLENGFGKQALRENFYRQRLLDLLAVKYVLNKEDGLADQWQPDQVTFPKEIYTLIWQDGQWQAYENKNILPRLFLFGDYQVVQDKQKIIDKLFDSQFNLQQKLILEENLPDSFVLDKESIGQIELLDYQPNQIKIKTDCSGPKLLFLSDNHYPGWQAFLDGKITKIYRANYTFRAVPIPSGQHEILFSYQPASFKIGAKVSLITLIFLIVFYLFKITILRGYL